MATKSIKKCFLCNNEDVEELQAVHAKGLRKLRDVSRERQDHHETLLQNCDEIFAHRACRSKYVDNRLIQAACKRKSGSDVFEPEVSEQFFPFSQNCFICGKEAKTDKIKKLKTTSRKPFKLACETTKKTISTKLLDKDDETSQQILARIRNVNLKEIGAVYHEECYRELSRSPHIQKSGPRSANIEESMNIIYQYIDNNDDCQFTLDELEELLSNQHKYVPCSQTLQQKLRDNYKNDIIISSKSKSRTLICLKTKQHRILREAWERQKENDEYEEDFRVAKMFAKIIRNQIKSIPSNVDNYPNPEEMFRHVNANIPSALLYFLKELILKDKENSSKPSYEDKCSAIAHAIISAVRPRSFLSALQLGVGVLIHRKFGSKNAVQLLNHLGFSCSYYEVQLYEASAAYYKPFKILPGSFLQFVADNADFNTDTLTGKNTFHFMGLISVVTPKSGLECDPKFGRLKEIPSESEIANTGHIQILDYDRSIGEGIKKLKYDTARRAIDLSPCSFTKANYIWMYNKQLTSNYFGWNGFIEKLTSEFDDYPFETSQVMFHPFIYGKPTDYETIYTTIMYFVEQSLVNKQNTCFITFDSPLYLKCKDIVAAKNISEEVYVVPRLGGFHITISYQASIGYIMSGSGIKEVLSLVYAENSAEMILNGGHFSRAIRAHTLLQVSLARIIFDELMLEPEFITIIENGKGFLSNLEQFITEQNTGSDNFQTDLNKLLTVPVVERITDLFANKLTQLEARGKTAKLWIRYFKMVSIMKDFYMAEKVGDWDMHLHSLEKMIPFFHASGHLSYAKSAQMYLQDMEALPEKMVADEYEMFKKNFSVRRTEKYTSGIFSDQTIEQTLNRDMKVEGGPFKRGATKSVVAKWLNTLICTNHITEGMEKFCRVSFDTSHQHKDSDTSRIETDSKDIIKFYEWFKSHNPFPETTELISLSTGIMGDARINPQDAFEVGLKIMADLDGKTFDQSLQRKNRVLPLSSMSKKTKAAVRGVTVNPFQMFQRIIVQKQSEEDLKEYFKYELSPFPMSIFDEEGLRKNTKSTLRTVFEELDHRQIDNCIYIVDGGLLLYRLKWQVNKKFSEILDQYVTHLRRTYSDNAIIVFDGYNESTTKSCERNRRDKMKDCVHYDFERDMPLTIAQERFLSSYKNKSKFIALLIETLQTNGFTCKQAEGDADCLIMNTAIEQTIVDIDSNIVLVAEDIDLLVLLAALAPNNREIFFHKPAKGKQVEQLYSSKSLDYSPTLKEHILVLHAMSGCDTTSSFYGKGKTRLVDLLLQSSTLQEAAATFKQPNANIQDIYASGVKLILAYYGATTYDIDLDEFRYLCFYQNVSKKNLAKKTEVLLCSLPPTSDAALQHIKRVYFQVQCWMGHELHPTDWGWEEKEDETLEPIRIIGPLAPDKLLKTIFCSCKNPCGKKCKCKCSGMKCTVACKHCVEKGCENLRLVGSEIQPVDNLDARLALNLVTERHKTYMENLLGTIFDDAETDDLLEEREEEDGRT